MTANPTKGAYWRIDAAGNEPAGFLIEFAGASHEYLLGAVYRGAMWLRNGECLNFKAGEGFGA
jgi:hypothetical protein